MRGLTLGALLLCSACVASEENYTLVVREPVALSKYSVLHEGVCDGSLFRLSLPNPVSRDIDRIAISYGGRRRLLEQNSALAALLDRRIGVTRVALRCSTGLKLVTIHTMTALASGGYVSGQAHVDRYLNVETEGPDPLPFEEFSELFDWFRADPDAP